jgi:subtilisin family serine protease
MTKAWSYVAAVLDNRSLVLLAALAAMPSAAAAQSIKGTEEDYRKRKAWIFADGLGGTLDQLLDPTTKKYLEPPALLEVLARQERLSANAIVGVVDPKRTLASLTITQALVDTGVLAQHPLLRRSVTQEIDFTGEGIADENGHGTQTAAFLLAGGPAKLVSIKAFDRDGASTYTVLVRALQWLSQRKKIRLAVVSGGLYLPCSAERAAAENRPAGTPSCETTQMCKVVARAARRGLTITALVGNTPGRVACPACCRDVIAVGDERSSTGAAVKAPSTP